MDLVPIYEVVELERTFWLNFGIMQVYSVTRSSVFIISQVVFTAGVSLLYRMFFNFYFKIKNLKIYV